ncbi:MAG: 30S ribosomal protein S13 [Candidatus Omnitrophica bacterium]|nr:30S ribosomal protein S13 [Candidatus Omnitrophota bacterium]
MARIVGIDLPREKRVDVGLTYIFGIGLVSSRKILKEATVDSSKRVKDLTDQEVAAISSAIQKGGYKVEGDLRRDIQQNIKRLMDIGCYRGSRHIKGLPTRGQRSHTNARTRKGKRKTVSRIKKAPAPAPA